MSTFRVRTLESGVQKYRNTGSETFDFVSVKVGASGIEMKETSGHFDFSAKKLVNVAQGAAAGEAVVLDANSQIPLTLIPPAALERLVVVADQAARFALTTATVQNGDTVKQTDTGEMWYVIDDTQLGSSAGYAVYTAGTASSVAWSGVSGTPTTLAGYGITDADAAGAAAAAQTAAESYADGLAANYDAAGAAAAAQTAAEAYADGLAPNYDAAGAAAAAETAAKSYADGLASNYDVAGAAATVQTNLNTHTSNTSNPHSVTKSQVGLGSVDDVQQLPMSYLDTDSSLTANSDAKVSSQKAIKSYVDAAVAGMNAPTQSFVNDNGSAITVRQIVFVKSNGHVDLAKADAIANCNGLLGVVSDSSIASTASGLVSIDSGTHVSGFSGLTPGAPVFLSPATAGVVTQTAPSTVGQVYLKLGRAISASVIEFDPEEAVEIAS